MRPAPANPRAAARPALTPFDTAVIFTLLAARDHPASEALVLRLLTGGGPLPSGRKELFELHFSLYHALYRLKAEIGRRGLYLHLDPMRIRMVRLPGAGRCHHYFPEEGRCCGLPCEEGGTCCALHHADRRDFCALSFDPLYDFYTNPDNISFGSSALLKKLMKGVIVYALRKGEVDAALARFGLERPTGKRIRKRYHELARACHPDIAGGDGTRMKDLNHAYQVLLEIFPA